MSSVVPAGYVYWDGFGYVLESDRSGPYAISSGGVATLMSGGGGISSITDMTTAALAGSAAEVNDFRVAVATTATEWETVSTTTYSIAGADATAKTKQFTHASGCLVTVPQALGLPVGSVIQWYQDAAAGQITFQGDGTSTVTSLDGSLVSSGAKSSGALVHLGSDDFLLVGQIGAIPVAFTVAISDETTAITIGTAKVSFRMPYAMTVTSVRASLATASSSGNPAFDVNDGGVSIFSTTLTIDATETTSTTAATPAVISDSALADDALITIDIDTAGTGAKGAKITFIGTRL